MTTHVSIVGTIGTDPRLIRTAADIPLCTFRLAHTVRRYDREKNVWTDGETSWYTVHAFRSLGEHAAASLTKGHRVLVAGRLRMRSWQSEERSGITAEIEADAVGPDLRWGTTRFTPAEQPEPRSAPPSATAPVSPLGDGAPGASRLGVPAAADAEAAA
ncbi:single-stranded DNA-binding protein [Leucobacter chromiireducens]|uniref:single-stranded DNA-binding protein n=1 Tax=Leucobacter chromiireducens TaxID=283877 RepID=UPI0013DDC4C8|nr:single-stranded DNA-binding protein [Leucobacter chromiireducens]